ncbi:RHS repeat-associated core domain-containing protein [Acidovorax cavernicola]|uniref:RHS repeat protein n=1 Tax=Acidovorax cavernicola TaxID=1675792 RepID=A0A9X8D878_9BURK|nr:RHS repeat-associated core domain-containing protein [Acidovorax cavernicola]RIX83200.1 RHS repeat protein [Acidovorax cavernicola]
MFKVKATRTLVSGLCVGVLAASGLASAQMQGGLQRVTPQSSTTSAVRVGISVAAQQGGATSTARTASVGSPVQFVSGKPALQYRPEDLPGSNDPIRREASQAASARSASPSAQSFVPAPGTIRANMPPVSGVDAQRVLQTRTFPANLNQGVPSVSTVSSDLSKASASQTSAMRIGGDGSPQGPASIAELARSLRNNPDLIYQYVRNNIEFYPLFGVQKGALGTVLDNQGTAYDQAMLMVELLRASGYTANYVQGVIKVTAAQLKEWYGIETSNVCGVIGLIGQSQIPLYEINATTAGSCPGLSAAMTDVSIEHIWVKVNIGGTNYVFDPSYKPHTLKTGIDLDNAIAYSRGVYLTSAYTDANVSDGFYAQNINRTNIRNNLTAYANKLATYLRANKPAATLDDVIGGKNIVPFYDVLRQTALPYQNTGWVANEISAIPSNYKPTLRIQYQGIDQTYTSDAIYGKRLTITYNASNQPILKLDGVAVGSPGTAATAGTYTTINFTVTHNAYAAGSSSNQSFSQRLKAGGTNTFLIANAWGPAGRGPVENHRRIQSDLRASGAAETSEPVLGSTLAMLGAQWLAQSTHNAHINERLSGAVILHQHQVGIAGFLNNAYVDLPGSMVTVANPAGQTDKESAAFTNWAMHQSILESTVVQQTTGVSAVSTVKIIDMAVEAGQTIYDATSSIYAESIRPRLDACAPFLAVFDSHIAAGQRLILPTRCDNGEGNWHGAGYFTIGSGLYLGSIVSDGLSGGLATASQTPLLANVFSGTAMIATPGLIPNSGTYYNDPIDMVSGAFLYDHEDINVGVGSFPQSLSFRRLYSSSLRTQNGPMGKGWTHNFNASVAVNSDGFQAMGEDSALDAVGTLVEQKISYDLMLNPARPIGQLVVAAVGQRWFGDQLVNNTVIVKQGLNGEVFVKLPDGTYNPPPGNSAKLTKNADGTYSYQTVNKAMLKFNAAGKAEAFTDSSGLQLKYAYTGADLASVTNSLGRALTFTNSGGKITQVGDGTRTVKFVYDANSNLTTFTDSLAQNTTYGYGLVGQMTKLFYPSFPTVAAVTNVYDTLGRVKTQTNARGKLYDYYFAGSRTEEVGPGGVAKTNYIDASGNVIQSSTPVGNWTVNTYDGHSRLLTKLLPEGNYNQYAYDDATCASVDKRCTHNVKTITSVGKSGSGLPNRVQSFAYETAFNKVATATDARGKVTSYTYTAQGLPLAVTSPVDAAGVAPQTSYTYVAYTPTGFATFYLPATQTVKTTSANSVITATTYNTANKYVPATSVVDFGTGKLDLTSTFTFDATGNLTVANGPRTDVTDTVTTAYDAGRRAIQVTDAAGKLTKTTYDKDGRPTITGAQIGTQWLVSCSRYSETGKVTRAWGPALTAAATTCPTEAAPVPITDTAYDDLDRAFRTTQFVAAADGGNRVTETVYNADDTVQIVKKAVGTALVQNYATYTYTPNGNLDSSKDAKNNLTVYLYDGFDRLSKTHYPLPATVNLANANDYEQNTYDPNGNVTAIRKRSGQSVTQTWDNLNRLTARTYPTTADNVSFGYDLRGLRTLAQYANGSHAITYAWDNAGRQLSTTAGGKTLAYQYDLAGNRIRTTWPDAFYTTTSYDALNRPGIIKENGSVNLATYAYDDLSRRTTVTLGNSTTVQRTYDTQGAMATLKNFLSSTAQEVQYTYVRNQIRELKSVTWSNNIYQWAGAAPGTQSYAANGLNQYTTAAGASLTYDTNGNLKTDGTWTYGYDLDNRLKTASKTVAPAVSAALAYDAEGRLRQTAIGANTINLLYDNMALVAEYNAAGAVVLRKYVHGPGLDEPIVWYEGTTVAAKNWLYTDHLGSIVATANGAGASTAAYTYGPFGEPNVATGLRFRYTGQQLVNELGLYYYKARFYSPKLGRFLQVDPIGYKDDQNLYAYVKNNSSNAIDRSGKYAEVLTSGNSVTINLPVMWMGEGATPAAIAAYTQAIQQTWSNCTCGAYGVTLNVTAVAPGTPRDKFNIIEVGPRNNSVNKGNAFASAVGGSYAKLNPFTGVGDAFNLYSAAHEAGHLMGLPDAYAYEGDSYGVAPGLPLPQYGSNIMGNAAGKPDEQDISNIKFLNSIGFKQGNGIYPSPPVGGLGSGSGLFK